MSVLPYRLRFLFLPAYWLCLAKLMFSGSGTRRLLDANGQLASPISVFLHVSLIAHPVFAIGNLLRFPFYFINQVVRKFLLASEDSKDEIVGYGQGKGVGGLIYWLILTIKSRRYGIFGCAHDNYFGIPLSIHCWPLAVWFLRTLGFRLYAIVAATLVAISLTWISTVSGTLNVLWIIPLFLCCNMALYNLYTSNWEILAWGFAAAATASVHAEQYYIAGIFMAALLLAHPGITLLVTVQISTTVLIGGHSLFDLLRIAVVSTPLTLWWMILYWRARHKLGRGYMINNIWGSTRGMSVETLYQFVTYVTFASICWWRFPFNSTLLLLLPAVVFLRNQLMHWTFSHYTTTNFMLFSIVIFTVMHPDPFVIAVALIFSFTRSDFILHTCKSSWGFDLTPVRMGSVRARLLALLSPSYGSRLALETGPTREHIGWSLLPSLTYVLASEDIDLVSAAYMEIGDAVIFKKYTRSYNDSVPEMEFRQACEGSGVQYFLTCTEVCTENFKSRGYLCLGQLEDVQLDESSGTPVTLTLFKLPWTAAFVDPPVEIQRLPNQLIFTAVAGRSYLLRFSSFAGWKARLNGRSIPIEDAEPGMRVSCSENGQVQFSYSIRNYFS